MGLMGLMRPMLCGGPEGQPPTANCQLQTANRQPYSVLDLLSG